MMPWSIDKLHVTGSILGAAVILVLSGLAQQTFAQSTVSVPKFEVASIRPNNNGSPAHRYFHLGPDFTAESVTLNDLILMAYEIKRFQLSGGPGWINSQWFDIHAKAKGNPT